MLSDYFKTFTAAAVIIAASAGASVAIDGADPFGLDLKEFKKPSATKTRQKKAPAASPSDTQAKQKPKSEKKVAKIPPVTKTTDAIKPVETVIPQVAPAPAKVVITPPPPPALPTVRIVRITSASGCELARKIMETATSGIKPEKLMEGATLPAVATASSYQGLSAILACGLNRAEEYTYRRILEEKGLGLVSVSADDTPQQVFQSIADSLAIPFSIDSEKPLVLNLPPDNGEHLPLRLIINGAADPQNGAR